MVGTTLSYYHITEAGRARHGRPSPRRRHEPQPPGGYQCSAEMFSRDPERLARSEHEVNLLASRNHPNIAAIYGLEQADSKRFLAVEPVEGVALARQIDRGPMAMDEALDVCRQIAEGLEAVRLR